MPLIVYCCSIIYHSAKLVYFEILIHMYGMYIQKHNIDPILYRFKQLLARERYY